MAVQGYRESALALDRPARWQSVVDRPDGRGKKNRFFDLLLKVGLKEIEVGFQRGRDRI
jgi:hypothetical protein